MSIVQEVVQKAMLNVIPHVPDRWLPGASPDPLRHEQVQFGRAVSRVDGPLKVQGKARFAAEVEMDGMLYAAVEFSTIAAGRIAALDTAAAEAAPGVALVMTWRNAPRMSPPAIMMTKPKAAGANDLPVMQDEVIRWNGQPVAVVLAETQEQADHAKSLIRVRYDLEPAVTCFADAMAKARVPDSILGEPPRVEIGDAEAALRAAATKVDAIYTTPRHNHNAIELHAATVAWNDGKLVVHDASQMINGTAWTLAQMFGIDEADVHVSSPFVGGGFGGKCLWDHQILAAAASKIAGRPVRLVLTREGVFRTVGGRTRTEQRVALGAKADGTLAALIHTGCVAMTPHNNCPEQFTFPARHLYATETMLLEQKVADMNMVVNTFMRAPGESVGTFALESALDELAHAMQLCPVELRRRIEPEKDPTSGHAFSSRHYQRALAEGAARFGWDRRSATPGARREGEWLVGMGVATATYPYFRMPGGAARITVTADHRATVQMASHEMGMGTATVQAQHLAARLGLPLENVAFEYGDSKMPDGTLAGGSSQTASIGATVIAVHEALVKRLIEKAGKESPLHGLSADEVETRDGGVWKVGEPERGESYAAILRRAGIAELSAEAKAPPPLEAQKYSMHSYGAQFCEVRVNAVTGETRVSRFLGSFDCGRILNPKTAASQFKGGIIMGLGLALTEETFFDERSGRIMNPSLAEYHVPVHLDVPAIDVMWTDEPDPHSPMGAHGIGEIGITGVGAAVANAIFNATGRRVRDLPITLDKLL
ncbi:xanthine dehydrogenase family protein molybdopterin-binding subunit [Xylophilus sp. GOD-11R]|uniref:xanthine dehydrogenase family protein molybdopterin-binding subunit n=1 Tax=Xylophilus sp. GOD-11R TaxID=3089814 RepID=UPI00298C6FDD|nr:xanthine dehydrogenase family protein molybdopterin-binding subunit [Xylophilus sp. GOD-11R]WPB57443.1 xanthine dehydrogenase family protein molybdopterin-binding subunit [Xylophilus sp. GOD-11R]